MGRRLQDLYQPGDQIEIFFAAGRGGWRSAADGSWQSAIVRRHQPPGMWVVTTDGHAWFVTNTRRVRPQTLPPVSAPSGG